MLGAGGQPSREEGRRREPLFKEASFLGVSRDPRGTAGLMLGGSWRHLGVQASTGSGPHPAGRRALGRAPSHACWNPELLSYALPPSGAAGPALIKGKKMDEAGTAVPPAGLGRRSWGPRSREPPVQLPT